ncbi:hypothetical protein Shal_1794 [Shewanella halifaxensis HAW-EB4]|uniref:SMODS-associated and fused to various effectors domain-containing protein n=1 Tax=Shewanella halifaxensis (strain HAW-EB4) TaxID=458817 RepID=B0TQW4_SHEHH|nr:SAVED domain-containing protein [Shewanella halifaxensis]ABZ76359.1 hypothetical protein Shal_1794 [Shewanella halifaxensis HAW-EB4]
MRIFLISMFKQGFKFLIRPRNVVFLSARLMMLVGFGGRAMTHFIFGVESSVGDKVTLAYQRTDNELILNSILLFIGFVGFMILVYEVITIIRLRKKTSQIVIEHIGLRERISSPLINAVTLKEGKADSLPIDLNDCYENGVVTKAELALQTTLFSLSKTLHNLKNQVGIRDSNVHYGGMPPVPLGFLAGYTLGNTSEINLWDYNRDEGWYKVDGFNDSNNPVVNWDLYKDESDEVCLILGISFFVHVSALGERIGGGSHVSISMPSTKHDNMSSIEKLKNFQSEFREIMNKFTSDGIRRVHIFCAAQASFNFAMGQQITKNHPTCIVYEFVNSESDMKYPWGIKFNEKSSEPSVYR